MSEAAQSLSAPGFRFDYQKLVRSAAWVFVACSAISFVEPSPYDLMFFIALPLWLLGGFVLHRSFLLFAFLLLAYTIVGFLALIPYWRETDASIYQYLSAYLAVTALFFALFVGDRTKERAETIASALAAGAFITSVCGVLGYFNIAGLGESFTRYGRAAGAFKDPNVFGSFLIPGVLYFAQNLMLQRARRIGATLFMLAVIIAGDLLSFSRGSWGATFVAASLMTFSAYATTPDARLKRRIAIFVLAATALVLLVLMGLLSIDSTREFFLQRASVTQDYDEGATGRFGNQLRALPMLIERFWGFGPLRFRIIFGIEAHDSYITAFANEGWLGGLLFVLIAAVTIFIGFRLMFRASPFQRAAQALFPPLFAYFLQAFQIDIDHWRHFLLLLGVVWGLEAARQKWELRQRRGVEV